MRTEMRSKERLILQCRRHWIVLVKPILIFFFVLIITIIAGIATNSFMTKSETFAKPIIWLIVVIINLFPLGNLIWRILERRYDIWAVTTLRVVDEWGVLSHNAKESPLDKINNVSYEQTLMGRLLNYGSVEIQTAAEMGATTYELVTNPRGLKDAITRGQEDAKESQISEQAEMLAEAIKRTNAPEPGETKECPFCAETIKANAKICRFCGREIAQGADQ